LKDVLDLEKGKVICAVYSDLARKVVFMKAGLKTKTECEGDRL
jgi:hypothetical protein